MIPKLKVDFASFTTNKNWLRLLDFSNSKDQLIDQSIPLAGIP